MCRRKERRRKRRNISCKARERRQNRCKKERSSEKEMKDLGLLVGASVAHVCPRSSCLHQRCGSRQKDERRCQRRRNTNGLAKNCLSSRHPRGPGGCSLIQSLEHVTNDTWLQQRLMLHLCLLSLLKTRTETSKYLFSPNVGRPPH